MLVDHLVAELIDRSSDRDAASIKFGNRRALRRAKAMLSGKTGTDPNAAPASRKLQKLVRTLLLPKTKKPRSDPRQADRLGAVLPYVMRPLCRTRTLLFEQKTPRPARANTVRSITCI